MNNQLHFDVLDFLKNIHINSFDFAFYLTYNPELVFIGICDESTAQQYLSQQSGHQITNQAIFFQAFQRSLTNPTTFSTKFDPLFYKSYYQIDHLLTPIDIASYWLLSGYPNNQNVISKNALIYYQQMDIDKIVHNTQINTSNYLISDTLQSQNNQTQDFINNLLSQNQSNSPPPTDQKQNLVIYFNQQLSFHFSSFKTHIDQYLSQSIQHNFDSYKNICDAYFQSKSNEFQQLLSSKSSQYQQLNLDKLNLFQDKNFTLISALSKKFDDFQQQFLSFQQNQTKNSNIDNQYKDFQLYIKQQLSQKNQSLQNNLIKNSYSSSPSLP